MFACLNNSMPHHAAFFVAGALVDGRPKQAPALAEQREVVLLEV